MPLGLQEHKVSTSGQPSEPESSPSFGQDTFCQSKADRLNPNCPDSSTHHHFAEEKTEFRNIKQLVTQLVSEWQS